MVALHQRANDYARFLPAINGNFARFARKSASAHKRPLPAGLTAQQFDFLDPGGLFYYPWALYTAAEGVNDTQPTMVSHRDRRTSFVLGDSGGYSLISGSVKESIDTFRERSLRWIETNCDVGLPVDVPTRAIDAQPDAWTFRKCLDATLHNTDYAVADACAGAHLLAVYKGRNHREARDWIAEMKTRRMWGIALGGHTRLDFWFWCKAIKTLVDDGFLDHIRHIHVLGTTEPGVAVLLTALKRALRSYLKRDDLEVTFDSSRAYRITQAYGQVTLGLKLGMAGNSGADNAFDFRSFTFPQQGGKVNRAAQFPFDSPLGRLCTIGDFMPAVSPAVPAFDAVGSNLLSHHETYMELGAIEQANLLCDMDQKQRSLVPWHIQEGVRTIHHLFQTGDAVYFDRRKALLQYYNKGLLESGFDDFR
ncbi:hypothetical protein LOK46_02320 [Methylobacterium sp. NMS14P]|uniref:hypothetical protein n=1 Tax=Methylobacterium sp. NMS14P TaxID=2894310 RepID=UPI0023583F9C|nr:hypothetical protein [Methylobacterium sp. NMS14P]WCS25696.1 hypothetical protein LOK46_02320 [Methylobacterium sp. NMS14P]